MRRGSCLIGLRSLVNGASESLIKAEDDVTLAPLDVFVTVAAVLAAAFTVFGAAVTVFGAAVTVLVTLPLDVTLTTRVFISTGLCCVGDRSLRLTPREGGRSLSVSASFPLFKGIYFTGIMTPPPPLF